MKKWIFLILLFSVILSPVISQAEEKVPKLDWESHLQIEEVDKLLEEEQDLPFSIKEYISDIVNGKTDCSLAQMWNTITLVLEEQLENYKETFLRILVLGIFAGIFLRFAGILGSMELGETGFYVVFLLLTGLLVSGFFIAFQVAEDAISQLLSFMKALIPSFSLALCYGGGSQTSLFFYQTMLVVLGFLEMFLSGILLPGVQIYFFLNVMNQLAERRFSRMVELIASFLRWSIKIIFGILIGYQGIQGMLLPVMDKVKNNTLWQTAKGLPGVGNTVGSVMDTILGSGILIKSAVGIGGVIGIVVLCLIPIGKLLVFTLMYKVGGAIIQPVSDGRIVSLLQSVATSGKFLLTYVVAGALMFILSITIVLVGTNMTLG